MGTIRRTAAIVGTTAAIAGITGSAVLLTQHQSTPEATLTVQSVGSGAELSPTPTPPVSVSPVEVPAQKPASHYLPKAQALPADVATQSDPNSGTLAVAPAPAATTAAPTASATPSPSPTPTDSSTGLPAPAPAPSTAQPPLPSGTPAVTATAPGNGH